MKLFGQSLTLELFVNGVDAVRHDQRRTGGAFSEEVAHRAVERAGHAHRFTVTGEQRERTFNAAHGVSVIGQDPRAGLLRAQVVDAVLRGVEQVHHAFDVLVHKIWCAEFNQSGHRSNRRCVPGQQ